MSALQFTINSDDEVELETDSDSEQEVAIPTKKSSNKKAAPSKKPLFKIDFDNGELYNRDNASKFKTNETEEESDSDEEGSDVEEEEEVENNDNVRIMPRTEERLARAAVKATKKKNSEPDSEDERDEYNTGMNAETEAAYFDSVVDSTKGSNGGGLLFSQLNLSRPFLRAIEAMAYIQPTPIQAQVIPYAMAGRDICASAVTGSGKTAAFVLPFLERLLYRPKDVASIRVLVITPTRELATQIHSVLVKLSQFTDITCALILGGKKDTKSQEAILRNRPDVVICTPGRMLDHLRNSHSVSIDELDVLVLDEVDRLLDLGFQEEVEQLVKFCPESRQTMLFSATMTPKVDDLAKLSLKRPIRIKTASSTTTLAPRLIQEFVKVRNETEVESMLLGLVCRSFGKKTIVFYDMKKDAHRFSALLGLMGVRVSELHGNLPQPQRDLALTRFREGLVDVMVCTDIAARGLDIPGVLCVINAEMPRNASTYVHRVGRTARAGNGGRAITLVADNRRKIMKEVLKGEGAALSLDGGSVLSRTIPAPVVSFYMAKIKELEPKMAAHFKDEKIKMQLDMMERETEHAENMLIHADEIAARPARTWYQSEYQKKAVKEQSLQKVKEEQEEARIGKAAVLAKRTAAEKAAALALTDDYKLDQTKDKNHRLSRKKRRRLESLAGVDEENAEESIKEKREFELAPKKAKMTIREKEKSDKDRPVGELGMKKITLQHFNDVDGELLEGRPAKKPKEHTKVIRQKFAVGGLDHDMMDWGGDSKASGISKKQARVAAQKESFSEFDLNKRLKKGGKDGKKAFKSKSKFKRRK